MRESGHRNRALVRFGGRASIWRILEALREAGIEHCATVGPDELRPSVQYGTLLEEQPGGAMANAWHGAQSLFDCSDALLFFPADTPLVTGPMIRQFLERVESRIVGGQAGAWFGAGLCPTPLFLQEFPNCPARSLRLRESRFVSGGLFATNRQGLEQGMSLFSEIRGNRKSIAKMAWRIGPIPFLLYACGFLTMQRAERVLSKTLGGQVVLDPTAHPATCMDFDTVQEYRALRAVLGP